MVAKGCVQEGKNGRTQPAGCRKGQSLTIIFKGTNACNAGCRFCSAAGHKGDQITAADFEILAGRIEEYIADAGIERLSFTFHGGEPTLLGAKFLEQVCIRLRQLPIPVSFSMQSNLLAFPAALLTVVRRHGIHVGSSVDPIESGRCTASGGDTFPAWLRNREVVANAGVYGGAIFLATQPAVKQGKRVYEILNATASLGEKQPVFQFNLVYPQGRAAENSDLLVSAEEGGRFLVEAYEAWEESGRESHVSLFGDFAEWFDSERQKAPGLSCGFMGRCQETHLGIDSSLNLAGCGRGLDAEAFYGNIRTDSIAALLKKSDERSKLATRSEQLKAGACADCEFFPVCKGGCPDDAVLGTGDLMDRTAHCVAYKMLFEAMAARAGAPRVQPAKLQPISNSVVHVGTVAGEAPNLAGSDERLECWLLPTADGRTLKFSSRLKNALNTRAQRVRIFVPGDQLKSLHLWAPVVSDSRVEVVLFDCPEALLDNLAVLGHLHAHVRLDLGSLFARGWSEREALELANRYLREADWKVRIEPFESMLVAAVRGERVPLKNCLGLTPGHYRVCIGSLAGVSDDGRRMVKELLESESAAATAYFANHRGCMDCKSFVVCGSRFASFTTGGCSNELRQLAAHLQASAVEIQTNLREESQVPA
jgi:uncharacterized protein